MKAFWFCEQCQAVGGTSHEEGDGVWKVMSEIGIDHKDVSPECQAPTVSLRVLNPAATSFDDIPEWAVERLSAVMAT